MITRHSKIGKNRNGRAKHKRPLTFSKVLIDINKQVSALNVVLNGTLTTVIKKSHNAVVDATKTIKELNGAFQH